MKEVSSSYTAIETRTNLINHCIPVVDPGFLKGEGVDPGLGGSRIFLKGGGGGGGAGAYNCCL